MSHIAKLGVIAYAVESSQDNWDRTIQAWFEGYATAINESGAITDEEYSEVIDALVIISEEVIRNGNQEG